MKNMFCKMGSIQGIIVVFSGLLVGNQPVSVIAAPYRESECPSRFEVLHLALLRFQDVPNGNAVFYWQVWRSCCFCPIYRQFLGYAFLCVGRIIVDGEGNNRFIFVLLIMEDTLINTFVPSCFSFVFLVFCGNRGHSYLFVCVTDAL